MPDRRPLTDADVDEILATPLLDLVIVLTSSGRQPDQAIDDLSRGVEILQRRYMDDVMEQLTRPGVFLALCWGCEDEDPGRMAEMVFSSAADRDAWVVGHHAATGHLIQAKDAPPGTKHGDITWERPT